MRLALFADIHANRQAFAACLDAARARGAERLVCLGDIVGYGADPEWAVDTVVGLVSEGAIAVRGNHDNAIGVPSDSMNADAQAAIDWTRGRLNGVLLPRLPVAAGFLPLPLVVAALTTTESSWSRNLAANCREGIGNHITSTIAPDFAGAASPLYRQEPGD